MKMTAKRRRSKIEIAEAKRQEELKKQQMLNYHSEVNELRRQLEEAQNINSMAASMYQNVENLVDEGILDGDPTKNLSFVEDPGQRSRLKEDRASKKKSLQQPTVINRREA